ncbi:MAG: DUF1700 domain-containing protein [Lachnospiraceae bacterium]|nr:DUF1700 domain-containing protein [Lachnospiraceae bacterium]
MNKNEFLAELKERLAGLSETDMNQSLDYYTEMIDDRMEDGLSEEEAVAAVGTPGEIAGEILGEMPLTKLVKARVKPKHRMAAWEVVLLVLGSPIWFSLLIVLFAVVFSLYISFWAVIISLWATVLALGAAALAGVFGLFTTIAAGHGWAGIALFGVGVFLAGLTIFAYYGCLYATKGIWFLGKKLFRSVKGCFIRKEAVR